MNKILKGLVKIGAEGLKGVNSPAGPVMGPLQAQFGALAEHLAGEREQHSQHIHVHHHNKKKGK